MLVPVFSAVGSSFALVFDDGVTRSLPDVSHHLRCYTASVAFPEFTSRLILSFRVMHCFTISAIIIARFLGYLRFFDFPRSPEGFRFVRHFGCSISFQKDYSLSCMKSLLFQFAKATSKLFGIFPGRYRYQSIYVNTLCDYLPYTTDWLKNQ